MSKIAKLSVGEEAAGFAKDYNRKQSKKQH